jgi:hypothetical protein
MVCGSEEIKKTIEDALHIKVQHVSFHTVCALLSRDAGLLQPGKFLGGPVRNPPHLRALTLLWC